MPKGNTWSNNLLALLLQNVAAPNIGNVGGLQPSTVAGSLYLSLHNAAPGVGGNQATNETAYTGYARVAVARASGATGWNVSGQSATLGQLTSFGQCSGGGGDTILFFGLGTASSGAGELLYYGAISSQAPSEAYGSLANNNIVVPGITFTVGQRVTFYAPAGTTLPGGITQDVVYFVKTVSGDVITVSTTNGGAAVTISADGAAMASLVTPIVVTAAPAVTPQLTTATTVTEG